MPLCASTGPVLGRFCQHRTSTGPVLAHTGWFQQTVQTPVRPSVFNSKPNLYLVRYGTTLYLVRYGTILYLVRYYRVILYYVECYLYLILCMWCVCLRGQVVNAVSNSSRNLLIFAAHYYLILSLLVAKCVVRRDNLTIHVAENSLNINRCCERK